MNGVRPPDMTNSPVSASASPTSEGSTAWGWRYLRIVGSGSWGFKLMGPWGYTGPLHEHVTRSYEAP